VRKPTDPRGAIVPREVPGGRVPRGRTAAGATGRRRGASRAGNPAAAYRGRYPGAESPGEGPRPERRGDGGREIRRRRVSASGAARTRASTGISRRRALCRVGYALGKPLTRGLSGTATQRPTGYVGMRGTGSAVRWGIDFRGTSAPATYPWLAWPRCVRRVRAKELTASPAGGGPRPPSQTGVRTAASGARRGTLSYGGRGASAPRVA
jgi:hypothetical protein